MPSRTTRSEAARPRAGSKGSSSNQFSAGGIGSAEMGVGAVLGAGGGGGPDLKGRGGGGGGCVEWARRRRFAILEWRGRIGGIVVV
jgi:hypothetical protein